MFLCTLARYVQYEFTRRLAPLLVNDDTPFVPVDHVAPAKRSSPGERQDRQRRPSDHRRGHRAV
ncbi:MAG: hypothetical protein ACLP8S_05825 [Solirubrobacteraceae bacterium]